MNKSEAYHLAQIAVVNSPSISPEKKLEVLKVLFDDENLAIYCEEKEMEKALAEIEAEMAAENEQI